MSKRGRAKHLIALALGAGIVISGYAQPQYCEKPLIPVRGVPFPQTMQQAPLTQIPWIQYPLAKQIPANHNQPAVQVPAGPISKKLPDLPEVTAAAPAAKDEPVKLAAPTSTPQPASLLPEDLAARQAAAVAASVVPPDKARAEISTLAGEYSYGNGFDMNVTLEISADGRFLYKRWDFEEVVDQSAGKITMDEQGNVILEPVQPRASWPKGTAPVLAPVSWGQRLYLVPQDDMLGFVNKVNLGLEPVSRGSMGSYYLREGDWDRPVEGVPNLPEQWKVYVLDKDVEGAVAGKDPNGRWIIDRGQAHGVYNGMEMTAWGPQGRRFVNVRVTDTGTNTSAIELLESPPMLSVQGWTVYTGVTPPPPPVQSANNN